MQKGYVKISINSGVGEIEFFHPSANALPSEYLRRMSDAILELSENEAVYVILLRSSGSVFCAGASFDELLSVKTESESIAFFEGFARLLLSIRNSRKMVIARACGRAVGGGVGILAACDYVFATDRLEVKLSELSIGIAPFVIAPALIRKIGIGSFNELYLNPSHWRSVDWCYEKGLVSEYLSSNEMLDNRINDFLVSMHSYSVLALEEIRKITWKDTSDWDLTLFENAKISGRLALSKQSQEKILKFKKR